MATPRVTIDQLPEQAVAEDTNFLVIQDEGITKKMAMTTMKNVTPTPLANHLAATVDAHDATAISATASGAGVDSITVQGQLGQLAGLVDGLPTQAEADTRYVNVTGDTMTGALVLSGAPSTGLHAATKQYVDDSITTSNPGITEAEADARYVNITGDLMSGALSLQGGLTVGNQPITSLGTGTAPTDAATVGQTVAKAGDTMEGPLILSGDPGGVLDAVTKQYADGLVAAAALDPRYTKKTGDTMTGLLVLSANPTAALGAVTKQYADGLVAAAALDPRYTKKTGDTMTGLLVLSADPAVALGAATKQYADGLVAAAALDPRYVKKSGDTMTAALIIGGDAGAGSIGLNAGSSGAFQALRNSTNPNIYCFKASPGFATGAHMVGFYGQTQSTILGTITMASTSSIAYQTTSDRRMKSLTRPVDPNEAIAKVGAMEPVHYTWLREPELGEQVGFFAQDLYEVAPEAVGVGHGELGEEDFQPWMTDLSRLIPTLVGAIQGLTQRVQQLEAAAGLAT